MELSEQTCSQRINNHLAGREEFLDSLYDAIDNDIEHDEISDPVDFLNCEFALDLEKMTVAKILLSTGGPGDWIEAFYDEECVYRVEYHFNDWFDHAKVTVSEDSSLWRYAEEMVEILRYS